MHDENWLGDRFEANRAHLGGVAFAARPAPIVGFVLQPNRQIPFLGPLREAYRSGSG
jgi:hypothetical protein